MERNQAAVAGENSRDVADDLGDTHHGDVFGSDDSLLAGGLHRVASEAGEGRFGQALVERGDQGRAVGVS